MTMPAMSGSNSSAPRSIAMPSMPGIIRSVKRSSNSLFFIASRASAPDVKPLGSYPLSASVLQSARVLAPSSSTIRIRAGTSGSDSRICPLDRHTFDECLTEFNQLRRLAKHPIDIRRDVAFGHEPLSPAREHDHGSIGRERFNRRGNFPAVHIGHSEVGNNDREWFITAVSGLERIDSCRSAVGRRY